MLLILQHITDTLKEVLSALFVSDLDIMSEDVKKILANPEDAQKYKDALQQLGKNGVSEVTIKLSDHSELTLVE